MEDEFLLAEIAKLYYIDQMKQKDIANLFGVTAIQISRMLKVAVEENVIQFHISMPVPIDFELGKQLRDRYGLRECIVIDEENPTEVSSKSAQYLSKYVFSLLQEDGILGVSWGRGIYDFVKQLPYANLKNVRTVQLSGGVFSESDYMVTPAHIVSTACERLSSIPVFLNAPFFAANKPMKQQLMEDAGICKVYELAPKASVSVIGASPLRRESTVSRVGIIAQEDIEELHQLGAVGDIAGYFIDRNGEQVIWSKSELYTGVPIGLVNQAETTICIAGEEEKEEIIRASLKRPYYNTLVTGKKLADALLK